jgi:lantibiotic modifying enzyme
MFTADDRSCWILLHRVELPQLNGDSAISTAEVQELWNGDIPYFQYNSDSTELLDARGQLVGSLLSQSPLHDVVTNIEQLADKDIERQVELVNFSFVQKLSRQDDVTAFDFIQSLRNMNDNLDVST